MRQCLAGIQPEGDAPRGTAVVAAHADGYEDPADGDANYDTDHDSYDGPQAAPSSQIKVAKGLRCTVIMLALDRRSVCMLTANV